MKKNARAASLMISFKQEQGGIFMKGVPEQRAILLGSTLQSMGLRCARQQRHLDITCRSDTRFDEADLMRLPLYKKSRTPARMVPAGVRLIIQIFS